MGCGPGIWLCYSIVSVIFLEIFEQERHDRLSLVRKVLLKWPGILLNKPFYVCLAVKAVQGNYTEWSEWSDCSTSCGPGEKFRTRNCTNPPPAFGGMDCSFIGMDRDVQKCEKRPCASEY